MIRNNENKWYFSHSNRKSKLALYNLTLNKKLCFISIQKFKKQLTKIKNEIFLQAI